MALELQFPSAISRYLVSNKMMHTSTSMVRIGCFHPLYRGTWFPTRRNKPAPDCHFTVSIRYIAVLGFQPIRNPEPACGPMFPSAISRYLVSNRGLRSRSRIPSTSFHPLYRGTWFPTLVGNLSNEAGSYVSIRYIAVLGFQRMAVSSSLTTWTRSFHPLYRGTWFPTKALELMVESSMFPSAISRYLVSNPTRKTPPLTSGGGNDLHTPLRIDHIPTFASLNHDKNTRSTHYTPNAGIEFSQAGFAPPTR